MYLFRNIFRIVTVLSCLCLVVFFVLEGCGGMSGGDEDFPEEIDRDWRDRNRDRDRDRGDRDDEDLESEEGGGGFLGFGKSNRSRSADEELDEDLEIITSPTINPSDDQNPLSEKIDFLFIVDTSNSNKEYIKESTIQKKLGNFIPKLNEENIDWRIYTTCGHTDDEETIYNGRLHELEHNGILIPFLYLDNSILNADDARDPLAYTSEVFIDTISHPSRRNCDMPPFCYRDRENRPLKALSGFLSTASKNEVLREDADLVIVIISNQDERPAKSKAFSKPKNPYDPRNIQAQLKEDFPDKTWHAVTFVVRSTDSDCTDGKASSYIPQLARLTGGLTANICSNTYAQTIIDFTREKQGKEVRRRRRSPPTTQQQVKSPGNIRNDIYGNIKRR